MHASTRVGDLSFAAAAAFLFGIFSASMGWNMLLLGGIGILALIATSLLSRTQKLRRIALVYILAATVGVFYYHGYARWQASQTHIPEGKHAAFFGEVTEAPKAAGNFTMLVISLSPPYSGTLDIFTSPNNDQFSYGDQLWISGSVSTSTDPSELPTMFLPRARVVAEHQGLWIKEKIIDLKNAIVKKIAQLLPADQAALLAGIMIGTAGTVSATLKAQMEASGTTYIVNMYGYKIAIIAAGLTAALKSRLPRTFLLWITIAAIVLFVFASGGSTSAVRASVMGAFAVIARGVGRIFNARTAVTFAAVGMVLLNATLLTDAGFQLSFLSFLGIYYLGPPINNYFHWTNGGALQWKEHAMLSLATNLAILPIVMNTFGGFSLTSFISNILIMIPWLAILAFGGLLTLFGFISPILAFCAAQIVSILIQYELFVIRIFAAVTIDIPAVFASSFAIALYYGALVIFAYYYGTPPQENN